MRDAIVRSYVRSTMSRMHWTDDRHHLFVEAVEFLGGERTATPKKILNYMDEGDLTLSQIKSHLQMYRNKKEGVSVKERRMIREMNQRQSQQYLQIYEYLQDAIQNEISTKKVTPTEVSCKSLYQSSRVGENENKANDVIAAGDGANGEEDMSLELTLGLKY
ncbi:PREDICTED: putative Myb family transcription factor At1g14600 [Camelina sativa]|uniref:Myb family transcription factor At1g14600 n=1 Tax=Camelina sativa TaxID=90675 RepID=A0ABM0TWS3_CAMSA|nr:PREDICTED: putative Myb family transcription factor At1g14600 [Camelina sativa]